MEFYRSFRHLSQDFFIFSSGALKGTNFDCIKNRLHKHKIPIKSFCFRPSSSTKRQEDLDLKGSLYLSSSTGKDTRAISWIKITSWGEKRVICAIYKHTSCSKKVERVKNNRRNGSEFHEIWIISAHTMGSTVVINAWNVYLTVLLCFRHFHRPEWMKGRLGLVRLSCHI